MKCTYLLLGAASGAVLLLASGCSKQEAPANPTSGASAVAEAGKEASQPAAPAKTAPPAIIAPPTVSPSPAATNAAAQPQAPAVSQPAVTPAASGSLGASLIQPSSLAQAATNQLQVLAAFATNRTLGALGMTNQGPLTTTNEVQALLERAKTLTANQKYQDALATVTELYSKKLTPDQKQKADDLKNQIQAALANKAASSLGDMFGGSKQ